jgi:hypothetical protein
MKTRKRKRSTVTQKPRAARRTPPARLLSAAQVRRAVEALGAPKGTARFTAGKALAVTAARDPARVHPHVDAIAALLGSDSKIVRWTAMQTLAGLAPVDAEHKLDAVIGPLLAFINGGDLVSAANAIQALGRIAVTRPDLVDRIVPGLLAVEQAQYRTPECRNVAIAQVLDALRANWAAVRHRTDVVGFVQRQRANTRPAAAKRAEKLAAELAP